MDTSIPQEVLNHVTAWKVAVDDRYRKCVDGGYQQQQDPGALARPGGDLGLSMALLDDQFEFTAKQAFELVYEFITAKGYEYSWHSDTHADPKDHGADPKDHEVDHEDRPVVGCGHCNAAINNASYYGSSSERFKELLSIVRQAQDSRDHMHFINLEREHGEQGVLVINSTDLSVLPWDQQKDIQFFIVDQARDQELLKELVQFLQNKGHRISMEELVAVVEKQNEATLGLLDSSKGKPMYLVSFIDSEIEIDLIGHCPDFTAVLQS